MGRLFNRQLRMATPVIMGETCVACHNDHALSPKTDRQVGDVRGIQEVFIDQPIADNGGIVMSYETFALVRDIVNARQMPPMTTKDISRTVISYAIEGAAGASSVISEHATGMDLFLDVNVLDEREGEHVCKMLARVISLIEGRARMGMTEPSKS